jgi:hypothetical protein
MLAIEQRDRERIARIAAGDSAGYWSLVQDGHDDLKWCGSGPFYTFMKAMPGCQADLLDYHQWQIDPHSVVSFGAIVFGRRPTNIQGASERSSPGGPPIL